MATTSTGYHPGTIIFQQPTSSGQIGTVSSGCSLDFEVDALLDLKSGSTCNMSGVVNRKSGSKITNESGSSQINSSGAYVRNAVAVHTSASTTIGYRGGHKRISSTIANTFKIKRPTKAGQNFTISVIGTSQIQTFRGSTAKLAQFGSTAGARWSMVVAPTSISKKTGVRIDLVAMSTLSWSPLVSRTTSVQVTFTTAT